MNEMCELELEGYEHNAVHRSISKKKARRSSGGLLLYFRNEYEDGEVILFNNADNYLWFKLKKCFFLLNKNIYICFCYVVPRNSSRKDLINTMFLTV